MTDQLHDDELFSLVRQAFPEIDGDTLSPTGLQARAVLDRVLDRTRLVELDQRAPLDGGNETARPDRGARRPARLPFAVPVGVMVAAAAAVLLIVSLATALLPSPRHPGNTQTRTTQQPSSTQPSGQTGRSVRPSGTWQLAGYITEPGWQAQLGSGSYVDQLTCPTTTTCYSAGPDLGVAQDSLPETQFVLTVTHNGGATWQQSLLPPDGTSFMGFTCPPTTTCMVPAVNGYNPAPGYMFTTVDGGQSWTSLPLPGGDVSLVQLSCATTSACVAVESQDNPMENVVYFTTDAGHDWTASAFSATFVPDIGSADDLQCFPNGRCISVGTSTSSAVQNTASMIYSTDGGATWESSTEPSVESDADVMSCADAEHCVSIEAMTQHDGMQNTTGVLVTDDGGQSWSASPADGLAAANGLSPLTFDAISCPTTTQCWASGEAGGSPKFDSNVPTQGQLMATADGGQSWHTEQLPAVQDATLQGVTSVSCPTATYCFAGAESLSGQQIMLSNDDASSFANPKVGTRTATG